MGDHTETTEIDFDPSIVSYDEVRDGAGSGDMLLARPPLNAPFNKHRGLLHLRRFLLCSLFFFLFSVFFAPTL
jgi:hypothetical protein